MRLIGFCFVVVLSFVLCFCKWGGGDCVFVCVCLCMCICLLVSARVCVRVYLLVRSCVCVRACMHACVCVCVKKYYNCIDDCWCLTYK